MDTAAPLAKLFNLQPNPENAIDNKTHHEQKTNEKAMEKFQEFILKLAETYSSAPLNLPRKTLLQNRLNQFISQYKTPDHPPYSAMIERALSELNEKKGSTEDEISQFIVKEYDSLPWVHSTLLGHHLEILCESGDIVETGAKRYLTRESTCLKSSTKGKKKTRKRKSRWAWESDRNKRRKKRNQSKGSIVECTEEHEKSDERFTENGVKCEENQNDGRMEVNEMEYSPQEREINPSELVNGHICDALNAEKQEEVQMSDNQPEVSSPERPGFDSIIAQNICDLGIFSNADISSQEQNIVAGQREFLDVPNSVEKLDSPVAPAEHDLSKSESLSELAELSVMECSPEAQEITGSVKDENTETVELHETTPTMSPASHQRCNYLKRSKEEAVPNVLVEEEQSGIASAPVEEFSRSRCAERQQSRWSFCATKAMNFVGPGRSPKSDHHQSLQLKLSDAETPQGQLKESVSLPNFEQHLLPGKRQCELLEADVMEVVRSATIESKLKEIKVYCRRRKTRPQQSKITFKVLPMSSDLSLLNAKVESRSLAMNEHEPLELL